MEITIHILDWAIFSIFSFIYGYIFKENFKYDTGLEGCFITMVYVILSIIYCTVTWFYDIPVPNFKFT